MRGDPFKSVAVEDAYELRRTKTCRQSGLGTDCADIPPNWLALDIFGKGPQRIRDPITQRARPAQIGTAGRIAGQVLVPEMQCPDRFAELDISTVGEQDRRARLTEANAQDTIRIICELVDTVIQAEYAIGLGDR